MACGKDLVAYCGGLECSGSVCGNPAAMVEVSAKRGQFYCSRCGSALFWSIRDNRRNHRRAKRNSGEPVDKVEYRETGCYDSGDYAVHIGGLGL